MKETSKFAKKDTRARTPKQIFERKNQIMDVCEHLFNKGGLEAANLKAISEETSLSRQTIYNYYASREEIFLDILKRDTLKWTEYIECGMREHESMTKHEYAEFITNSFVLHKTRLRLTPMLFGVLLEGSGDNKIHQNYSGDTPNTWFLLLDSIKKYFPDLGDEKQKLFANTVLAFAIGLHSLNFRTEKSAKIVHSTNLYSKYPTQDMNEDDFFYNTCYEFVMFFLEDA